MNERAFVIAGDRAVVIANDLNDCRYRAAAHYVPVGVQVPVRSHAQYDVLLMLEDGTLEFMIGGAAMLIEAPSFARVPRGVPYAYRNAGEHIARLLVRADTPSPARPKARATIEYAA